MGMIVSAMRLPTASSQDHPNMSSALLLQPVIVSRASIVMTASREESKINHVRSFAFSGSLCSDAACASPYERWHDVRRGDRYSPRQPRTGPEGRALAAEFLRVTACGRTHRPDRYGAETRGRPCGGKSGDRNL